MRPLIALFHLICIFPPKDWNLRTFSPSPLQSQSRWATRDWTGDLLTHLITQTRVFISILHHLYYFCSSLRGTQKEERNGFNSFSHSFPLHLKRTIIFPLFIFADGALFKMHNFLSRMMPPKGPTPLKHEISFILLSYVMVLVWGVSARPCLKPKLRALCSFISTQRLT